MMNRDLMARQMFANGGAVPSDVQAIVNGLYDAMRGSNADVRQYVQENRRDLSDIAQMFPQFDKAISQVLSQRLGPQSPAEGAGAALMAENAGMGQMMTPVDPPQGGVTQEFIPPGPDGVDPGYGAQNNAPLSQEDLDTLGRMQRNQDRERQEQESFGMRPPPPPPPAALPGIPMAMGGEPMAAAMDQMGADPMAGMMGGEPMAGMMGGEPMAAMGAPPSADLGPATTEGIASQIDPQIAQIIQGAAQNFGDPETAENAEQMMNMVRGDQATVEERRMELGEMVGPEDAAQTPESVLTLVQPVLMMASMDTGGIGPMAQEAMNVPVTGEMAGGIMSMAGGPPEPEGGVPPVNFNQGGEVLRFNQGKVVPLPTGPRRAYAANTQLAQLAGMPLAAPAAAPKDLAALAKEKAEVYRDIVGGGDAAGDKDLAQAQFYQDLAKFGFGLMQAPKPEEAGSTFSLAQAGRVANEVGLGQNTLTLMAQQRAARKAADRQLNLAALSASEAEMTATSKAEADAAAKANVARINALSKAEDRAFEADKFEKISDDVDPLSGITYTARTRMVKGEDGKYKKITERVKRKDGTHILKNIPLGVQTKNFMDETGRMIVHTLRSNVPNAKWIKTNFVAAAPKTEIIAGKAYTVGPNGFIEAPNVDASEYVFKEETGPGGTKVNVAYNKDNPEDKMILGTSDRPTPQIKQDGRRFIQFTLNQDGSGFAAKEVFKAGAEDQLFTLGKSRYAYNPDTKKVTSIVTAPGDPVIKIVKDRLVSIKDPSKPEEFTVLADYSGPKKMKVKNFVFGSQELANTFGQGELNALVTQDETGNLYITKEVTGENGQKRTERVPLSSQALVGASLPSDTTIAEIREKYKVASRDKELVSGIGADGVIRLDAEDIEGDSYNTASPDVMELSDFRLQKNADGKTVMERVPATASKYYQLSMAEAADAGLGFGSGIRERVSYVLSPTGWGRNATTAKGRNTMRRLIVLTRDAFVNNPRMPVAELERVATIYPDPDNLWRNKENEKDKLYDLRQTLRDAQQRNKQTLQGNFPPELKAEARMNMFKVSRVLSMMAGLDAPASKVQQATDLIGPPNLVGGKKVGVVQ